jgi:hypothetical protein
LRDPRGAVPGVRGYGAVVKLASLVGGYTASQACSEAVWFVLPSGVFGKIDNAAIAFRARSRFVNCSQFKVGVCGMDGRFWFEKMSLDGASNCATGTSQMACCAFGQTCGWLVSLVPVESNVVLMFVFV